MPGLDVVFTEGTHRLARPEETLKRIMPLMPAMGITRLADVTGLDRIGIPTWCAIRPMGRTQVVNGKGTSHAAAKVSALMEAAEFWHWESAAGSPIRASAIVLERQGCIVARSSELPNYHPGLHLTDHRVIDWVKAEELHSRAPIWLPAAAVRVRQPRFGRYGSNGLASGNHLIEATLHALYEVIERDAMARLIDGSVKLPKGESRVLDLDSVPPGPVAELRSRIKKAGVELLLVRVDCVAPVQTFWAILFERDAGLACSCINWGSGSHLSGTVAAMRAITEAAQVRLTYIHGAREDLNLAHYRYDEADRRLLRFFESQRGELDWNMIADESSRDLGIDLATVLTGLNGAGYRRIYRAELTQPRFGIPVVKLLVPGLMEKDF